MSLMLLDGDWDVDGRVSYSWYVLNEVDATLSYSWYILEEVSRALSFSWDIYGTVAKAFSYSWEIINTFSSTVGYSWEIFRQVGSSKIHHLFRKDIRRTIFNSADQNPLTGDVKRHRWWKTK
jgi:hypothetical protein